MIPPHTKGMVNLCTQCQLPECIADHPLCPFRNRRRKDKGHIRPGLCFLCDHAQIVVSPSPLAPIYFFCRALDQYVAGYKQTCAQAVLVPGTSAQRDRIRRRICKDLHVSCGRMQSVGGRKDDDRWKP